MNPRPLRAFVLLCGFVRSSPVALGVPPQSGEGASEFVRRVGRGEGSAEIIQGHKHSTPGYEIGAVTTILHIDVRRPHGTPRNTGIYSNLPAAGPTAVACLVFESIPISAT